MIPKNPFLEENSEEQYSLLDVAMDALTTFTVKRNLSKYYPVYTIKKNPDKTIKGKQLIPNVF